jgi:PAS domain S-box-containing protein
VFEQLKRMQSIREVCVDPQTIKSLDNLQISMSSEISKIQQKVDSLLKDHEKLGALSGIGRVVNSSLDLSTVLQIVMDTIIRLTAAERGFLMLDDEHGELQIKVARNWEKETIAKDEVTFSSTLINQVVISGEPILTTNAQQDPRFDNQESVISYNLRSILCVPLKVKGLLTGIIYTDNRIKAGLFTDKELEILKGFADQAAVALENARLYESVKQTLGEVTQLKQLLDNAFASVTSGVITTDLENKINLCNSAAARIFSINTQEIIGKPIHEEIPCFRDEFRKAQMEAIEKGVIILEQDHFLKTEPCPKSSLRLVISPLRTTEEKVIGTVIVIDDLTDRKKLEASQRLFERMVSPEIIKQLDPNQLELGGTKKVLTVLFADIRDFTSFSEITAPENLIVLLNKYLSCASDIILEHGGTIDKFIGDGILAWFNAPLTQADHIYRAVRASLEIQSAVAQLHDGDHAFNFGIGIHTGEAILGLVGTEKKMEYTAIGDTVNTAKRIQELAGPGQIMVSKTVEEAIRQGINVVDVGSIAVKGKTEPIAVFQVNGVRVL